jgi:hypothetical protein
MNALSGSIPDLRVLVIHQPVRAEDVYRLNAEHRDSRHDETARVADRQLSLLALRQI